MHCTLTDEEFDTTPHALEQVYAIAGRNPHREPVPQPVSPPEDLRAALALIAPDSLPTFDAEHAAALRQAREQVSAAPVRRFVGQWAVYVAVERHPDRAAALRALESRAATTDSHEEARAIASEIGRILDAACAEAGIEQVQRTT